jgi:hypothetical protein
MKTVKIVNISKTPRTTKQTSVKGPTVVLNKNWKQKLSPVKSSSNLNLTVKKPEQPIKITAAVVKHENIKKKAPMTMRNMSIKSDKNTINYNSLTNKDKEEVNSESTRDPFFKSQPIKFFPNGGKLMQNVENDESNILKFDDTSSFLAGNNKISSKTLRTEKSPKTQKTKIIEKNNQDEINIHFEDGSHFLNLDLGKNLEEESEQHTIITNNDQLKYLKFLDFEDENRSLDSNSNSGKESVFNSPQGGLFPTEICCQEEELSISHITQRKASSSLNLANKLFQIPKNKLSNISVISNYDFLNDEDSPRIDNKIVENSYYCSETEEFDKIEDNDIIMPRIVSYRENCLKSHLDVLNLNFILRCLYHKSEIITEVNNLFNYLF